MGKLLTIKQNRSKDTDLSTTSNTRFMIDGEELRGVHYAELQFRPDEFVVAELHMWGELSDITNAIPRFFMNHPKSGDIKEVASIKFVDGEEYEF